MTPSYSIAGARPEDLRFLPAIELAAVTLFTGPEFDAIPHEPTSPDVLRKAQRDGHVWVALAGGAPVGFALVELIEPGGAHLEEIDVHPDHGRRGLGTWLVKQVCQWAAAGGYSSITLTTFRDVPWNMPFYARLGFEVVPSAELSPALRAIVDAEARRGLDPARRVVMRRRSATSEVLPLRPDGLTERNPRMRTRLHNGDVFPDLTVDLVGGGAIALPRDLAGSYAVVLFYRGSWCPYCNAQLAAFSRAQDVLGKAGVTTVALSVDDEATSKALVEKLRLSFPVGFGANADHVAAATGAYVADGSAYLQSTGFVLDRHGRILTAVYSSGAIGRLVPDDVVGFVKYVEGQSAANPAVALQQQ
jgi:peroxiredoxin/GNAT superfamily N-acetyltransferase